MTPSPAISGPRGLLCAPPEAGGFPPRVVAALRGAGVAALEALLHPLPPLPRLDPDARALLERISAWTAAAANGLPPPLSLPEWIELFLAPRLADAVKIHHGLLDPATAISLHESKLRETGFKLGVSRERARQILADAFASLSSPLPLFAARPLFAAALRALRLAGGVLDARALSSLADPAWGGSSPVGAFLLLARVRPGSLFLYRDFFSAFSPAHLERFENALRDFMLANPGPRPISDLCRGLPPSAFPPGSSSPEPLAAMLLRHLHDAFATLDGRCGLAPRDSAELVREILSRIGESPLRSIVDSFNCLLHPECRRGSGFVRGVLLADPLVRKTSPGRFALPGGIQTFFHVPQEPTLP